MVTRWGGLATILKDGVGARIPPIIALSEVNNALEQKVGIEHENDTEVER